MKLMHYRFSIRPGPRGSLIRPAQIPPAPLRSLVRRCSDSSTIFDLIYRASKRPGERGMAKALSLPMVAGAVVIGVISGKMLFGPPLEEYWSKKLKEEASKETPPNNMTSPNSTTS